MNKVEISTEFIKLDQFLKWVAIADNGVVAKAIIADGMIKVNSEVCTMRGKKLRKGDIVEVEGVDSFEIC
ncbi:RNA-binding S4 domain-containing protein [Clostridium cylindrosporum]|uniref:S4 domain-containing protein n=1 Tax=Clostridium cylindrosporum DSM 605 TaxID=1121307 RepID=A0A0J8DBQ3_CLOCY|nr:RNA-binding S4 domain-containing protein [Clostridium cylindrosporum]KMT21739.1 S4 domain-containing protein [Clostridium cylindrosporum DSM 605]